jgi:hypothetical protein
VADIAMKLVAAWKPGPEIEFPDAEHAAASSFLRELAVSDCSPATVRSYAFAVAALVRFAHERLVSWERAERVDVRAFVEFLRETPNPQRQCVLRCEAVRQAPRRRRLLQLGQRQHEHRAAR